MFVSILNFRKADEWYLEECKEKVEFLLCGAFVEEFTTRLNNVAHESDPEKFVWWVE